MSKKIEAIKNQIESLISENSILRNVSHVGFSIDSTGTLMWKKSSLKVIGRVNTEKELDELNKIINEEAKNCDVINNVRVEYRS